MKSKLTLTMDGSLVEAAKQFASERHTSLSKLVEAYLKTITREAAPHKRLPGVVGELAGLLKGRDADDSGAAYAGHLDEKYR